MIEFYKKNFDFGDTYKKFIGIVDFLAAHRNQLEIESLDKFRSPTDLSEIVPLLKDLYKDHYAVADAVSHTFKIDNFTNNKIDEFTDVIVEKDYAICNRTIFFINPLSIEAQSIALSMNDYDKNEILFEHVGIILENQLKELGHKLNKYLLAKKVSLKELSIEKKFQDLIKYCIENKATKLKIYTDNNSVKAIIYAEGVYLKKKEITLTEIHNFNDLKNILKSRFKSGTNESIEWKYYTSFYKIVFNQESDDQNIYLDIYNLTEEIRSIKNIALTDKDAAILTNGLKAPSGLIVISGNASSGKRSVMYSIINEIKNIRQGVNVITFENEVKVNLDDVTQINDINIDMNKLSSHSVVAVDNNVSTDNISSLINLATKGKLVIAVVESSSIFNTLNYLYESVSNKETLVENLISIIHVGLLNTVCNSCSFSIPFNKNKYAHFFVSLENAPKTSDIIKEENKEGCEDCNYGFKGRLQLCEIIDNDSILKDLFLKNYNIANYKTEKRSKAWVSMFETSMKLVSEGKISLNSVIHSIGYYKK